MISLLHVGSFERKKRKKRHGDSGGGKASNVIVLSPSVVKDSASIGDTVGTLSVVGGSGTYSFFLLSNPGNLFSISGNLLLVASALAVGNDVIIVEADNGVGDTPSNPLLVSVVRAYVPTFELLGF